MTRRTRMWRAHPETDRGSVLVLTLGLVVVAVMVLAVVVDVGVLVRARQEVLAHADAAALAATQAVDMDQLTSTGFISTDLGLAVPLDPQDASDQARAQTRAAATVSRLERLRIVNVTSDGVHVSVVMTAEVQLPFTGAVLGLLDDGGRVAVRGTSRARTIVAP